MKLQWAGTNALGRLECYLARTPGNQARSGRKNQDSEGRCWQTRRQDGGEVGKEGGKKKKNQGDKDTERCSKKKKKRQKRCLEWQRPQRELHTHRTLPGTGAWPLPTRIKASPRRLRNMIPSGLTYSCHNLLPFPHLYHPKDPGAQPSWY